MSRNFVQEIREGILDENQNKVLRAHPTAEQNFFFFSLGGIVQSLATCSARVFGSAESKDGALPSGVAGQCGAASLAVNCMDGPLRLLIRLSINFLYYIKRY